MMYFIFGLISVMLRLRRRCHISKIKDMRLQGNRRTSEMMISEARGDVNKDEISYCPLVYFLLHITIVL